MHNNDIVDHERDKTNKWTTETRINQIGEMKNSLSSVFLRCMLNAMPGFLPWRDFAFFLRNHNGMDIELYGKKETLYWYK